MLGTRPDIAFLVIKLLQFSSNPMEEHLQKALYIVRYLQTGLEMLKYHILPLVMPSSWETALSHGYLGNNEG